MTTVSIAVFLFALVLTVAALAGLLIAYRSLSDRDD